MLIEFHRHYSEKPNEDDGSRISVEAKEIMSIHEGRGRLTIITTRSGKVAVEESYDDAVKLREEGCRAF